MSEKLVSVQRLAEIAHSLARGVSPQFSETANLHATAIYTAIARVFDEAAKPEKRQ